MAHVPVSLGFSVTSYLSKSFRFSISKFKNATWTSLQRNYHQLQQKVEPLPRHSIEIRTMREEDISQLMNLRRQLGIHDATSSVQSWMAVDPEGIKVAVNENGDIVGSCSYVKNHPELYFAGIYCVQKEYRNYNVGIQIFNAAKENAKDKNIAANSVLSMAKKYQQSGDFPIIDEDLTTVKNYFPDPIHSEMLFNKDLPANIEIEPFQECLLPSIVQYDASVVGHTRELILRLSCHEEDSRTFAAFRNGVCIGFGSIKRSCLGAGRVGPLYAEDPVVAEALLKKLIESYPNRNGLAISTPSSNIPNNAILQKLGNAKTETCLRIYRKQKVNVNASKIYAYLDINFSAF
ncbi:acetyltransf_18 domain-containing protein [Trichonephila clavata]|uniref:Acetyltransf_18 domain-containing protein n=1 Tax=Trichonephila clavata TaxID=2740835 RepID=A0A8X6KXY8_TRICU|nr:acetyltransf_18 domain-containing protein [Trichonephila clavata]